MLGTARLVITISLKTSPMEDQLKTRGVEGLWEIDHGWCRSVYTVDPNGIMVEFCVTTKPEEFRQSEEEAGEHERW